MTIAGEPLPGILIRKPTILGPDGNVISQTDHPIVAERKAQPPTKEQIAEARKQAAQAGFRIIKQSPNTRRGNIRRARQAELKRTLKGTGKSIVDHLRETHVAEPGNQARMKIERQKRREERERLDAELGS